MGLTRKAVVLAAWALSTGAVEGAVIQSNSVDGGWSSSSSWSPSVVPTKDDDVIIQPTHKITVDTLTAQARFVQVDGTLSFSRSVDSELTLVGGSFQVRPLGKLDMGTEAEPISVSTVSATLTLALGSGATRYGLVIESGGAFTSRGADKSPVALATTDLSAGGTSLQVPASDIQGWAVGDTILISQTERAAPTFVNQTEERVLTGISGGVLSWTGGACDTSPGYSASGGLCYSHMESVGIRVTNLTRNVVVRSSGANTASTTAYIHKKTDAATKFTAVQTEFIGLGFNSALPEQGGIYLENASGVISSCTISRGWVGVEVGGGALALSGSVLYKNQNNLVARGATALLTAESNDVIASTGSGILIQSPARILSNAVYSNVSNGIFVNNAASVGVQVEGNLFLANGGAGVSVPSGGGASATRVGLFSNRSLRNTSYGFTVTGQNHVLAGNEASSNYQSGFKFDVFQNGLTAGNRAALNGASPGDSGFMSSGNNGGSVSLGDIAYFNSGAGYDHQSSGVEVFDQFVSGFNESGADASNGVYGFFSNAGAVAMRRPRVQSLNLSPGASMIAYGVNSSTGDVQVFGNYTLASGQTLTIDHVQESYSASATTPILLRGTGHSLTVTNVSPNALSQAVRVHYRSGQWRVEGSSSGLMGVPFNGDQTGISFGGQFTMNFDEATPEEGDVLAFGLMSGSADAGYPKRLQVARVGGSGPPPVLSVPATSALTLRGQPGGTSAVLEGVSSGGFTFSSSGSLTLENVSVTGTDVQGLQLSGSAGVVMSSVTFDNIVGAGGAYITARNLVSDATFYSMVFDDPANNGADANALYSVNVQGVDSGLRWYFVDFGGARSGDMKDNDPNQKVLWADAAGPQPPGGPFAATLGANEGEISLIWTTPADIESDLSTSTLKGGTFRIYRSTNQAARDGAVVSDAQAAVAASAPPGTPQTRVEPGLLLGATYYFRLWAADEFGNGSSGADAQGLARRFPVSLPSNFQATAASNTVTLTWTPTAPPDAAYRGDYRLERSTESGAGYGTVALVPASSTTYTDPDLAYETDYYYRLTARDNGTPPLESGPVQASTRTAEVTDPSVSLISVGASAVGVAWTGRTVALNFNKTMNAASVAAAVGFRRVKDNMGNPLNEDLTGSVAVGGTGSQYAVTLPALAGNSTYELTVATTAGDNFGKFLAGPSALRFTTLMDRSQENVVTEGTGGAVVRVPPNALAQDGYLMGSGLPESQFAAATRKLAETTGDPLRVPFAGVVDLRVYDGSGTALDGPFQAPVTVSLPYPDVGGDGIVDGTSARARTLAVYWLKEPEGLWVRLPSAIDASSRMASAEARRFTAFALMAQADTDLSTAHPYPVPWTPRSGRSDVVFTGVGDMPVIRIYTLSGALVREIKGPCTMGECAWNLRNQEGEPVATGVYYYEVSNGENRATGTLAVVK